MTLFFRGLVIGLSVAAVVGPMSVLCIQRTLQRGFLYGLISGLGVATADAACGSIAAFGLTLITTFLVNQHKRISLSGVFLGSALWWCLLTGGIGVLRGKFAAVWLLWINRLSGGVITLFGLVALLILARG